MSALAKMSDCFSAYAICPRLFLVCGFFNEKSTFDFQVIKTVIKTRNTLVATYKKFYGLHSVLIDRFKVSDIITDLFLETLYR